MTQHKIKKVKFLMSSKNEYIFDLETAEAIIDSRDQLVKIMDADGRWTGKTINKAHIIETKDVWEWPDPGEMKALPEPITGGIITAERRREILEGGEWGKEYNKNKRKNP